jgi:lipopolysaccharide cholinephosphotransferase
MEKKTYDKKNLRKLQLVELDILKDFIAICEKYKLPYFATGGTAIGALRHQGFIPWDDDIDVCMLREDYNKFMDVAPKEMGEKYIFMTTDTEKKYPLMFGKMVKRGTRFVEDAYQQGNYPLGIYIDIFPYDKTSENERLRTKYQKKTWFWARLQVLTLIPDPNLPPGMKGWKKKVAEWGCRTLHVLFKIFCITPQMCTNKYLKWATYCEDDSDLYIDYSYISGENLMIRTKSSFPTVKFKFEDTEVALVKNFDAFLRPEYGDYMQMPPEGERHNHYASFIDFGDGETCN